ncbi:MAG: HisA/HisF-related TIM barrel protein [Chloroflexi bacterium]|nr:HisA/HisF-related TIM barrel protein [Chloroflexota bacterium]
MIIYPAIDLRQGRCVRLRHGDVNAKTNFTDNPVEIAQQWVSQGAEWLHVVNLDGALGVTQAQIDTLYRPSNILIQRPGTEKPQSPEDDLLRRLPVNLCRLREIRRAIGVPIQFSGGLRTLEDIRLALELGANRVVIGTAAIENPDLVEAALEQWGAERIVIGMNARNGLIAIQGWPSSSGVNVVELGHRLHALGVKHIVYTDMERDGTLAGVNVEATSRLGDITGLQVIASGGVANLHDIEQLKAHEHYNIEGVIVDQAIYLGRLALPAAVAVGHQPLTRRSAGIVPYRRGANGLEFLLLFNLFFEQWQFPRGGVKDNESDKACAIREFHEETGLAVEKFHEECEVVLKYTASIRNYEIERTIVYYLAQVASSEIHLGHENHCEARWQSVEETWELLTETSPEQLPAFDAALAYLHQS